MQVQLTITVKGCYSLEKLGTLKIPGRSFRSMGSDHMLLRFLVCREEHVHSYSNEEGAGKDGCPMDV